MVSSSVRGTAGLKNMAFQASSHRGVNVSENECVRMDIPTLDQVTAVVLDGETPVILLSIQRDLVVAVHPSGGICLLCRLLSIVTYVGSDRDQLSMTPPHRPWNRYANLSMTKSLLVRRE